MWGLMGDSNGSFNVKSGSHHQMVKSFMLILFVLGLEDSLGLGLR